MPFKKKQRLKEANDAYHTALRELALAKRNRDRGDKATNTERAAALVKAEEELDTARATWKRLDGRRRLYAPTVSMHANQLRQDHRTWDFAPAH